MKLPLCSGKLQRFEKGEKADGKNRDASALNQYEITIKRMQQLSNIQHCQCVTDFVFLSLKVQHVQGDRSRSSPPSSDKTSSKIYISAEKDNFKREGKYLVFQHLLFEGRTGNFWGVGEQTLGQPKNI